MEQKRFISKISRIAQGYTMKALRGLDMNLSELHALRSITWLPGQSQTELSERLSVDKAAIARTITRLEKKGYICRQEDEKDRRINRLYPLEKASQVKEESISVENDFYDWLFEVLEPAERPGPAHRAGQGGAPRWLHPRPRPGRNERINHPQKEERGLAPSRPS